MPMRHTRYVETESAQVSFRWKKAAATKNLKQYITHSHFPNNEWCLCRGLILRKTMRLRPLVKNNIRNHRSHRRRHSLYAGVRGSRECRLRATNTWCLGTGTEEREDDVLEQAEYTLSTAIVMTSIGTGSPVWCSPVQTS